MPASIVPSITVSNTEEYRQAIYRLSHFAHRLHIDLADGEFAPTQLISPDDVWWPGNVQADVHLMYKQPEQALDYLLALKPQLIIIHAESNGDFSELADIIHQAGIEVGVALLPQTPVELIRPALDLINHVLIFAGKLGYYGGEADMSMLAKVKTIRTLKPQLEIAWDGGVNNFNCAEIIAGGVDVVNVGAYISKSADPTEAYRNLKKLTEL